MVSCVTPSPFAYEHDLFDHAPTATVRLATPDERAPSLVVVSVFKD
jgi:hypothetical protein